MFEKNPDQDMIKDINADIISGDDDGYIDSVIIASSYYCTPGWSGSSASTACGK